MGDNEEIMIKLEQIHGDVRLHSAKQTTALETMAADVRELTQRLDKHVTVLVWALIGSALGTEGLKIIASLFLKVGG